MRRYARELFGRISEIDAGIEAVAIGGPAHAAVPAGITTAAAASLAPTNFGWVALSLPLAIRRAAVDLFHAPAYTAPIWGVHPLAVTIHDCSYARHPDWYPYRRDALRRAFYRRSALAADAIITDSEFSRREIVAAYGVDPETVAVVPLGASSPFRNAAGSRLPIGDQPPFALHVGDLHPRRDLTTALAAVVAVRQRAPGFARLRLVLVGADRGSAEALKRQAEAAGQPEALDFLGVVSDTDLLRCYLQASLLIYPSRYEGFGLPLVEAMACGVPIIAARAGSIPEVVGDAALLVGPGDVRSFADALERVVSDPELTRRLSDASSRRAARFTWERTASETVAVYRACADALTKAARFRVPIA